jgi:hypothetical protein
MLRAFDAFESSRIQPEFIMRKLLVILCATIAICVLQLRADDEQPVASPGTPATADEDQAAEEEAGTALFNGEDLAGWKITDFGGEGDVRVEEECLILDLGEPLTGITWDGDELPRTNYEITLQAKRVEGNDFFCGFTFPVGEDYCSLILGGWGGGVVGLSSINGQDASENETTRYMTFERDRWYDVKIRVDETHIQAWLDDTRVANIDHTVEEIGIRIEMTLCRPLGISTFRTRGAIRDLRIRELTEADTESGDN